MWRCTHVTYIVYDTTSLGLIMFVVSNRSCDILMKASLVCINLAMWSDLHNKSPHFIGWDFKVNFTIVLPVHSQINTSNCVWKVINRKFICNGEFWWPTDFFLALSALRQLPQATQPVTHLHTLW